MDFAGENYFKPDWEEIRKYADDHVEFDDKEHNIYWLVVYDNEMYFLYKREHEDDMPHEYDGICQTTEVHDVIFTIEEYYCMQLDEINEELEAEHTKQILTFLNKIWSLDELGRSSFDIGIFKMMKKMGMVEGEIVSIDDLSEEQLIAMFEAEDN